MTPQDAGAAITAAVLGLLALALLAGGLLCWWARR